MLVAAGDAASAELISSSNDGDSLVVVVAIAVGVVLLLVAVFAMVSKARARQEMSRPAIRKPPQPFSPISSHAIGTTSTSSSSAEVEYGPAVTPRKDEGQDTMYL